MSDDKAELEELQDQNDDELPREDVEFKEAVKRDFKKILVVDDILYVVKSISKILKDEGYFVITAMTGVEAIEKFENYSPDLVTIDQNLPDMTGSDLVTRLRKQEGGNNVRIVFISAVYDKEIIKSILQLGVDNYLIKPFKKNKLTDAVRSLLGD
jgi:DNA-binding response OmpR family regulator